MILLGYGFLLKDYGLDNLYWILQNFTKIESLYVVKIA